MNLREVNVVLQKKLEKLQEHYVKTYKMNQENLGASLDKAVKDIQQYVDALQLGPELVNLYNSNVQYNAHNELYEMIPGGASNVPGSLELGHNSGFCVTTQSNDGYPRRLAYAPIFTCANNSLCLAGLYAKQEILAKAQNEEDSPGKFRWYTDNNYDAHYLTFDEYRKDGLWILERLQELGLKDIQALPSEQWEAFLNEISDNAA